MNLTPKVIREILREKMIDPELGINVVDLGLVYDIKILPRTTLTGSRGLRPRVARARVRGSGMPADFSKEKNLGPSEKVPKVHILMTLTTPGCPLAAVFHPMVRQALADIPGLDPFQDIDVELTFDPPWHQGMMSARAKAQLGFNE